MAATSTSKHVKITCFTVHWPSRNHIVPYEIYRSNKKFACFEGWRRLPNHHKATPKCLTSHQKNLSFPRKKWPTKFSPPRHFWRGLNQITLGKPRSALKNLPHTPKKSRHSLSKTTQIPPKKPHRFLPQGWWLPTSSDAFNWNRNQLTAVNLARNRYGTIWFDWINVLSAKKRAHARSARVLTKIQSPNTKNVFSLFVETTIKSFYLGSKKNFRLPAGTPLGPVWKGPWSAGSGVDRFLSLSSIDWCIFSSIWVVLVMLLKRFWWHLIFAKKYFINFQKVKKQNI